MLRYFKSMDVCRLLLLTLWLVAAAADQRGVYNCSRTEALHQAAAMFERYDKDIKWLSCPAETWLYRLQELAGHGPKIIYDIGCGKGYSTSKAFALWDVPRAFNPRTLYDFYQSKAPNFPGHISDECGVCHTDVHPRGEQHSEAAITIHCFEPSQDLHQLLQLAHTEFFSGKHRSPGQSLWQIHNMAMTNTNTTVQFQRHCVSEKCSVHWLDTDADPETTHVPASSVDRFSLDNNIRFIDVLRVDTEGHDPAVLAGAVQMLKRQRIGMLSFEYNEGGAWSETTLKQVVDWLDGLGYVCFLDGLPMLTQLTGCWSSEYEFHRWSYVVCTTATHPVFEYLSENSFLKKKKIHRLHHMKAKVRRHRLSRH